jgi:acyl phosphate:glycerol-3-phosphate acyltransferase
VKLEIETMAFWTTSAVGLVIAYLFGSTPTGYLAGKLLKGIDIREHGSKSTGATNVLRTLGKWPGLVVLIADVLKGVGAIIVARSFCPWLYTELSLANLGAMGCLPGRNCRAVGA